MVSYEELIYCFTDIYLKTAMECSICKENYMMEDDVQFLDEYVKQFCVLLTAIEKDDTLEIDNIKQTLEKKKSEKLNEFRRSLQRKIVEKAIEKVAVTADDECTLADSHEYIEKIKEFCEKVFSESGEVESDSPVKLLKYVRAKEESL